MTKLEPNSMPSSKNMWAQPMSDLSINSMGYQYSPMYGGGPTPRHSSSYPHMPAGTGVPQQPSGKFLAGPGENDRSPSSSSSSSSKKKASQGKRQSIQQQPQQPQQQTSPQMMMQDPSMAISMDHMSKNSAKPAHSYSYLITTAIQGSPNQQMTLNDIYEWVMEHYPWYKTAVNGWKNSIRHNLSLNKAFRREPRPPSEPGKGSYWRLDPEHKHHVLNEVGAPVPGGGSGMSRSSRSSRRSSAGQRGSSSRGSSRRATSDPTPHPMPTGAPIPEIPLTPVPVLPKRPGHETDPYVFKIETHPTPTIIPTLNTSTSNRRHSHLLSHDHAYTSPQEQLQHIEQQHQGYGNTMNSQFSLSGLNTQTHHHGGLFSPTSPTGPGPNNDYGYQTSMYSQNAPNHLPGPGGMMDSSGQDSRFSNQGFYFPQNGANPGMGPGRPLSMGGHNNGHYEYHPSHSYSAMNQNGSAGAPFYTSSPGYGLPSLGRTPSSGGNAGNNSPPNSGGSSGYAGPPSYRSFHDYGNNNGSEYGSNGHSRASSMMSLSSPVGSFMGTSTSSSSGPYPIPQSSFGSSGGNSSGMLSPISPPSIPTSTPTTPSSSSGNNSMRQPGSIAIAQETKGQAPGGGNTMRSHPTW